MAQSNVEILRDLYDAFAAGDVAGVTAGFTDAVTWHVPGDSPIAGDYTGADEVVAFFGLISELSRGTYRQDIHALLHDADDRVAAVVTGHGELDGESTSFGQIHVWQMLDGKALSFRAYHDGPRESNYWTACAAT